ncbi:MAG TPA: hypothetical protein IAA29_02060 [Candidatus Paenibacillus intestinavium]|nr:hypothetical protein [Candidatus Paenibacillus intestinavium]
MYGTSTQAVKRSKLQIEVQKAGFQNRAGEALLEQGGSANVRYWYMRTVLAKFASDAMSNTLRQHNHRYQSPLFELHNNKKAEP